MFSALYDFCVTNFSIFTSFLFCSYAIGWSLVAYKAYKEGYLDLCDFVRRFIFAPFVLTGVSFVGFIAYLLIVDLIIPNFLAILGGVLGFAVAVALVTFTGIYVVTPAVKKSYGVVEPFTSKLCVVMYNKNTKKKK